jgi:ABC-type Zn2+ transport system substrate-binding protein/surface adhesin
MMKGRFASLTSRQSVTNFRNTSWKLLEIAIFESEEGEEGEDDEDDDNDDDDDDDDDADDDEDEEEEDGNAFLI